MPRIPYEGWKRARAKLAQFVGWIVTRSTDNRLLIQAGPNGTIIALGTDHENAYWVARRLDLAAHYENARMELTPKDAMRLVSTHDLELDRLRAAYALGRASRQTEYDAAQSLKQAEIVMLHDKVKNLEHLLHHASQE